MGVAPAAQRRWAPADREIVNGQMAYAVPSPNLNRAYLLYASTLPNEEYLILDVSRKSLRIQAIPGQVIGWWDDNQIVSKSTSGSFELYDLDKKNEHSVAISRIFKRVVCRKWDTRARKCWYFSELGWARISLLSYGSA
jgi:hypothetical protein